MEPIAETGGRMRRRMMNLCLCAPETNMNSKTREALSVEVNRKLAEVNRKLSWIYEQGNHPFILLCLRRKSFCVFCFSKTMAK